MPDIHFSRPQTPRLAAVLLAAGCACWFGVGCATQAALLCPETTLPGADLFTNGAIHQILTQIQ